jgi:alpha-galactosidase
LSPDERQSVASAVAWHKRHRPLLHSGTVYRADHPDPTMSIHGVVSADGDEAVVSITRVGSGVSHHSAPVVVRGLQPDRRFEVRVDNPVAGGALGKARQQPAWLESCLVATGRQLSVTGFHAPQLDPETTVVVHIVTI